jgi:hypothetical protein
MPANCTHCLQSLRVADRSEAHPNVHRKCETEYVAKRTCPVCGDNKKPDKPRCARCQKKHLQTQAQAREVLPEPAFKPSKIATTPLRCHCGEPILNVLEHLRDCANWECQKCSTRVMRACESYSEQARKVYPRRMAA